MNLKRVRGLFQSSSFHTYSKTVSKRLSCLLCLLLALGLVSGCAKRQTFRIAVADTSSQKMLGALVQEMLADEGIESEVVPVTGGFKDIQPALAAGYFDIAPQYTGQGWSNGLNKTTPYSLMNFPALEKGYQKMGLTWMGLSNIYDVYTLAMREDQAAELDISTLSDLKEYANSLTLGADAQYISSADGLPFVKGMYDMAFKTVKNLPYEDLYSALMSEDVDLIPVHSLEMAEPLEGLRILEEDLNIQNASELGFVVSQETLDKNPKIAGVMDELAVQLDMPNLIMLEAEVFEKGLSFNQAARRFFNRSGLYPNASS